MKKNGFCGFLAAILLSTPLCANENSPQPSPPPDENPAAENPAAENPAAENPAAASALPSFDRDTLLLARLSGLFREEDPESLFSFRLSDSQVEFMVDGTWNMLVSSTAAISFSGTAQTLAFTSPVFSQSVELASRVCIDQSWYFESSFAEEFTQNTLAAGYSGKEGNPVRQVRIGNSLIAFPDGYPWLAYGNGGSGSPGISASFSGSTWRADSMLRYDAAARHEKTYSGNSEITETLIPITSWISGKWFVLPSPAPSSPVRVFVEDPDGTASGTGNRRWKELDPSGYRFSGATGVLELTHRTSSAVAVGYADAQNISESLMPFLVETVTFFGGPTGPAVSEHWLDNPETADAPDRAKKRYFIEIDGSPALLLQDTGFFSPFMLCSRYQGIGSGAAGSATVVHTGTGAVSTQFEVAPAGDEWNELSAAATPDAWNTGLRSPAARFPLFPMYPSIYFPSHGGNLPDTDLALRTGRTEPVDAIQPGTSALPGTITVTRNGFPEPGFTFDSGTGILTLSEPPRTGETIRVSWLENHPGSRNASLVFSNGIQWNPFDRLTLSAGAGTTWNVSGSGYTDSGSGSPGHAIVSASLDWKNAETAPVRIGISSKSALEIQLEDTTGLYRLYGADGASRTVYPAAAWYRLLPAHRTPVLGAPFAEEGNEILLEKAAEADPERTTGGELRTFTDQAVTGSLLDFSANLGQARFWTAVEILCGASGATDLSAADSIAIALKNTGTEAEYALYLQAGAATDTAYENPALVRTWKLDPVPSGNIWTVRTVKLAPEDRSKLAAGGNLRLVAVLEDPLTETARVSLVSGPLETIPLALSARSLPENPEAHITAGERSDPAPEPLAIRFAGTVGRFNAGKINRVLETEFEPGTTVRDFEIAARLPAAPFRSYREFGFFIFIPEYPAPPADAVVEAVLSSTNQDGTERLAALLELPAALLEAGIWHKISLDKDRHVLTIDDTPVPPDKVIVLLDETAAVSRLSFRFRNWPELPSGQNWTVCLDEAYFGRTEAVPGIRNETRIDFSHDGPVLSVGKHPILSAPRLGITMKTGANSRAPDGTADGMLEVSMELLGAQLSGALDFGAQNPVSVRNTMYRVRIPAGPVSFEEYVSANQERGTWNRTNRLELASPVRLALNTASASGIAEQTQTSEAQSGLRIGIFRSDISSRFSQVLRNIGSGNIESPEQYGYSALWISSAQLSFSAGKDDALRRSGSHSAGFSLLPADSGKLGMTIRLEASSVYTAATRPELKSESKLALSLPVAVHTAVITPAWTRSAGANAGTERGGSYRSDSSYLAKQIADFSQLYATVPLFDLFSEDIPDRTRNAGNGSTVFTNTYSIDFRRTSAGRFSDLYIPSSAVISVRRETVTDENSSTYRDVLSFPVKAGFSAFNSAGRYSARNWFSWYVQDEFVHLYSWTPKIDRAGFSWSFDASHSASLFFADGGTFTADNSLRLDATAESRSIAFKDALRILWKRHGKTSPLWAPVSHFARGVEVSAQREDSLGITVEQKNGPLVLKFTVDHIESVSIGKNGEIRFQTGASLFEPLTAHAKAELRAGLGGKITF